MNDEADVWSTVSAEWAELWGDFANPVRRALGQATGIRAGNRVLDVGCGSGEFLRMLAETGVVVAGIDPAAGMVELARAAVPDGDIRLGSAEALPWPNASFDVVAAVNAVHLSEDPEAAVAEMARVALPGGFVALANWADSAHNDIHAIEQAIAASFDEELPPDDELRLPGGLERLIRSAGLEIVSAGSVPAPWEASDEATLVRGILLGEDSEGLANGAQAVVDAAGRFRIPDGRYRLQNAFRFVVGRTHAA